MNDKFNNQNASFNNDSKEQNYNQSSSGENSSWQNYSGYGYNYNQSVPSSNSKKHKKPQNKKSKNQGSSNFLLTAVICAIIGGIVGGGTTYLIAPTINGSPATSQNITIDESYNSSVEAVADKVLPSVVGITLMQQISTGSQIPFFFQQPGASTQEETEATVSEGSGVIYKENGYIITNYHVIESAVENETVKIKVYLEQDKETGYDATIVGYDAGADLAVIKIDKTGLTPIEIGNSDEIQVGQTAIAVGNPGGMDFMGSVSSGIVSGLNRTITLESGIEMNLIQTDAAINPGNSGGALVDGSGKLIGISSAKLASANFEGMGFAIPVNDAVTICDNLIQNEGKTTPYLGITMDTRYTSTYLESRGFPAGVVVSSVAEGSPAQAAGLASGDIITKVDGTATPSADVLKSEIAKHNVGDTVQLEVYRFNTTATVSVTLGEASMQ